MIDYILNNEKIACFDGKKLIDEKERTLFTRHENKNVVIERYPDMSESQKKLIIGLLKMFEIDEDEKEILSFLNFEDEIFCS